MTQQISKLEKTKLPGRLWISLATGLMLLFTLTALTGCNKNGANGSNTKAGSTVVKNSIGMEFAPIPAGSFKMGLDSYSDESPVHQVTFASAFNMGRYEVTQAQWQKVMGNNPSSDKGCGENCPVEKVSWDDTQEFIKKLNAMNDGYTYRLPSEAEWEYACRAGTMGADSGDLDSIAWYGKNSDGKLHPVGQKQPNAWGLYDMRGNVLEWIMDEYHGDYSGAPTDGSAWLGGGESNKRMYRNGSWFSDASEVRSTRRDRYSPDSKFDNLGFRLVASPRS
jgi:formylglycine-generating enzyme required for sulfatase activity